MQLATAINNTVVSGSIIDSYSAGAGLQLLYSVCIIKHTPCVRILNLNWATPFGQLNQPDYRSVAIKNVQTY